MKAIKLLMMTMVVLCITCIGCSKYDENDGNMQVKSNQVPAVSNENENVLGYNKSWTDNFDAPYSLTSNWTLYGNPQPKWVQSAYGKTGLFDNNGPSPTKNFAVSHKVVGSGYGYTVESEVLLKILNPSGTCVCPGIGISKELNPIIKNGEIETGISFRIIYAGANATWFPAASRGSTWFVINYLTETNQNASYTIKANLYSNDWHTLKIVVSPFRFVKFYCDNTLIWAPTQKMNSMMESNRNIILGYTSDGDPLTRAGCAYHNFVKTSFIINEIN